MNTDIEGWNAKVKDFAESKEGWRPLFRIFRSGQACDAVGDYTSGGMLGFISFSPTYAGSSQLPK
jgi:hypothetical protein